MKKLNQWMINGTRKLQEGYRAFGRGAFSLSARLKRTLAGNSGENFVDSALKVLIAVVIGALLLAGLYALFKDTVLPTVTNRVKELFDYAG